ncbi:MAG: hypothetical protein LBK57_08590 [Clostridiales Family XIII bacterium]|nr:hypothetical protein [Clostridiales Family XIII bacterium]
MKSVTISISDKLHNMLSEAARAQGMGLKACVKEALEQYAKTFDDMINSPAGKELAEIFSAYHGIPSPAEASSGNGGRKKRLGEIVRMSDLIAVGKAGGKTPRA